ncbi:MAG: hypothetical protein EB127_19350 [Alphaproteobacteria bacterium]|nr:hypothetical protein [Alphaproteobacteria bacterium]
MTNRNIIKEIMTENTSYGEVAKWIRKTYLTCYRYSDVGLWHPIYGEMNTIWDVIRVIEKKHKEELK